MKKILLMMALVLMVGIATTFCFSGCNNNNNNQMGRGYISEYIEIINTLE